MKMDINVNFSAAPAADQAPSAAERRLTAILAALAHNLNQRTDLIMTQFTKLTAFLALNSAHLDAIGADIDAMASQAVLAKQANDDLRAQLEAALGADLPPDILAALDAADAAATALQTKADTAANRTPPAAPPADEHNDPAPEPVIPPADPVADAPPPVEPPAPTDDGA